MNVGIAILRAADVFPIVTNSIISQHDPILPSRVLPELSHPNHTTDKYKLNSFQLDNKLQIGRQ